MLLIVFQDANIISDPQKAVRSARWIPVSVCRQCDAFNHGIANIYFFRGVKIPITNDPKVLAGESKNNGQPFWFVLPLTVTHR